MNKSKISLFSEGNIYFSTFMPLVKSFIDKKMNISYYTLDPKDEILKIKNEFLKAKYLGYKFISYIKFSLIEAEYLLSTTPNIGTPGYPYQKPKLVKNLVHVFHSISDISIYRKGSLDNYDSVILVGEFQKKSIRELEKKRGLKQKDLLPLGVPYLDHLIESKKTNSFSKSTILIASSWGNKGCLRNYGIKFIKELSKKEYNIIVRPHPHSLIYEKRFINNCKRELLNCKNIEWDDSVSPSESMNKSNILISDTSSIRFDFLFVHNKPVITLDINRDEMKGYEREYIDIDWTDRSSYDIGPVLKKEHIHKLESKIRLSFNSVDKSKLLKYRDKTIYNFGKGANSIADFFINH